ncbi:monovalent cation:H+ antiporter, CPA1 (nhx1) [Coemansia sp. Benny D115]|nr:monovalent cation:H+ antiporter, CPA1 (nhx1) [Coemansia sp. Benny D115]
MASLTDSSTVQTLGMHFVALATSAIPTGTPAEPSEPLPEEEEKASSQALLILVTLLIAALLTSYYLQRWRIRTVHETVLSIFAGMVVGLVMRFSTGDYIKRIVTFDHTIFFNMLLPPIILNCGYNLQKTSITRNMGPVLVFAFIGTAISAVVIGILVQMYSITGVESIGFSLLDSMILGTILSATDPVTILAVFEQLRVDPKLFSIIFGETVFNDAVAIVLFVTLSSLRAAGQDLTFGALPHMLSSFMFVFTASLIVGMAMGVIMSLLLVLSVGIFGGTTPQVVQLLGIRTGVSQPDSSDEDEDDDGGEEEQQRHNGRGGGGRRRRVIDLSANQQPHNIDGNSRGIAAEGAIDSSQSHQALDISDDEHDNEAEESIALNNLPGSLGRISSSWADDSNLSWYARIRNSYRSFDRSLIYDIDHDNQ